MDSIYPSINLQLKHKNESKIVLDAISYNKNTLIGHSNLRFRIIELARILAREHFGDRASAEVVFYKPPAYPNTYVSLANCVAKAAITVYDNTTREPRWTCNLTFPVAVGSYLCPTYGKTNSENFVNGERWREVGGYFASSSGMEDIIRINEKKQTLLPLSTVNKTVYEEEIKKLTKKNGDGPLVRRGAGDQNVQRFITTIYVYDILFRTHMMNIFMYEGVIHMSYNFAKFSGYCFSGVSTNIYTFFMDLLYSCGLPRNKETGAIIPLDAVDRKSQVVDVFHNIIDTMVDSKVHYHFRVLVADTEKKFLEDPLKNSQMIVHSLRNYKANNSPATDLAHVLEIRGETDPHEIIYRKLAMICVPLITFVSDRLKVATNGRIDTDIDNYGTKMYVPSCEMLFSMIREQLLSEFTKRNKVGNAAVNPKNSTNHGNDNGTSKLIQKLERETYYSVLAKMRSIMVNSSQHVSNRAREVRLDSQMGCIDPFYTPESDKVGLRKELAIFAWISLYRQNDRILYYLSKVPQEPVNSTNIPSIFFVNGVPQCRITEETYHQLRAFCKKQEDLFDVVFTKIHTHFACNTMGGSIGHFVFTSMPRYVLDNVLANRTQELRKDVLERLPGTERFLLVDLFNLLPEFMTQAQEKTGYFSREFVTLLSNGAVEFLAASEVGESSIAIDASQYADEDYAEIDPTAFLCFTALSVPFSNKTFGVRLAYQSNMVQQSFCSQPGTLNAKNVSQGYLTSGQPAICNTETGYQIEEHCTAGSNIIVGFTMQSMNSEDSFICSESCTKTLLRYAKFKKLPVNVKIMSSTQEFDIAGILPGGDASNYKNVDPRTGLPVLNCHVYPGDVIFARYKAVTENGVVRYVDSSIRADVDHCGVITTIAIHKGLIKAGTKLSSNYMFDVIFGNYRHYIAGDKICARYAQKQTCGQVVPDSVLPMICTGPSTGTKVEMLMSPAMFPSRQTSALISEIVSATHGAHFGHYVNSTPFRECDINRMKYELEDVRRGEIRIALEKSGKFSEEEYTRQCAALGDPDPNFMIYDEHGQVDVAIGGHMVKVEVRDKTDEAFARSISHLHKQEFMEAYDNYLKDVSVREGHSRRYDVVVGGRRSKMMVGVVRINLLRHQARDKIKVSMTNPASIQGTRFRQTRSGRDGGLRFNKQENNAVVAGGAPTVANERHSILGDGASTMYCSKCGLRNTRDTSDTTCSSCGGTCYMCKSTFGSIILEQALLQAGLVYRCRSEPI